jgi:hypothetical protein
LTISWLNPFTFGSGRPQYPARSGISAIIVPTNVLKFAESPDEAGPNMARRARNLPVPVQHQSAAILGSQFFAINNRSANFAGGTCFAEITDSRLKPIIAKTFPFDEINALLSKSESSHEKPMSCPC